MLGFVLEATVQGPQRSRVRLADTLEAQCGDDDHDPAARHRAFHLLHRWAQPIGTRGGGLIDLGRSGEEIRTRLDRFYNRVANSGIPEAEQLAAALETWWPAIEAPIVTGFSNARSEGYNRVAKLAARNAYGFRNPENQRLRVRCACTRQHRRETSVITSKST